MCFYPCLSYTYQSKPYLKNIGLIDCSILIKVQRLHGILIGNMNAGFAHFEPTNEINHRLVKRFVGLAKAYNWRSDRSLLVLRDVLGLRRYVRTSFIKAISAVSQCLVHYAQYTPTDIGNGSRALFVIPDQIYISTIANSCNVSRYTVYRVLDYLAAIGDCETVTKYCPETKVFMPTKIVLTSTLFTRIGMPFEELQKAMRNLEKKASETLEKNKQTKSFITNRIGKELRPAVRRRLGLGTERVLSTIESDKAEHKNTIEFISNPNFLPDSLPDELKMKMDRSMVNDDRKSLKQSFTAPKPILQIDPRFIELRKAGLSISEANAEFKKLIYASMGQVAKKS